MIKLKFLNLDFEEKFSSADQLEKAIQLYCALPDANKRSIIAEQYLIVTNDKKSLGVWELYAIGRPIFNVVK